MFPGTFPVIPVFIKIANVTTEEGHHDKRGIAVPDFWL